MVTTVLLGAGASYDAGLPLSTGLTQAIAEHLDRSGRFTGTTQALNFAIGSLIAHDAARGTSPYDSIDVERLFSAVEMLADRSNLEVAPFVASWNAALDTLGSSQDMSFSFPRDFNREIFAQRTHNSSYWRVFREGVESVVGRSSDPVYRRLQDEMISALRRVLTVDPAAIDYLSPLFSISSDDLRIATLNYDRSIELLAERAGRSLDTGVEAWQGGAHWTWADGVSTKLLRLHGSIDWWYVSDRPPDGRLTETTVSVGHHPPQGSWYAKLAVIFGQRGKLRSEGPFLPMLNEFDRMLADTDRLIVVGYSFRDDHINTAVRRWFNSRENRGLTLIDPSLRNQSSAPRSTTEFGRELVRAIHESVPRVHGFDRVQRHPHEVVSRGARAGLIEVLGSGPDLFPATVEVLAPEADLT